MLLLPWHLARRPGVHERIGGSLAVWFDVVVHVREVTPGHGL